MRQKLDPQLYLSWATASDAKIVRAYEKKYNGIGRILEDIDLLRTVSLT